MTKTNSTCLSLIANKKEQNENSINNNNSLDIFNPTSKFMNIKQLRLSKGLSRKMVAFGAGVSQTTIVKLESGGYVSPELLKRIMQVINEWRENV